MQDRDLDKLMQKWADDETASAPKMRPTAEMYEQVASLGRKRSLDLLIARRPVWATALAVVVILVLAATLVQLFAPVMPWGGQHVAYVPQRVAFVAETGPQRDEPPPRGKGPPSELSPFSQLVLQVRKAGSPVVRSVDLLAPYAQAVVLTAEDSYRLVLEPAAARYVYVYQQTPAGALVSLYPNETYSTVQNPMRAAETVYLPAEPSGFYLESGGGTFRLYVVAAESPASELESLYERYTRGGIRFDRRKSLDSLQERLDALVSGQVEGSSGWVSEFEVR